MLPLVLHFWCEFSLPQLGLLYIRSVDISTISSFFWSIHLGPLMNLFSGKQHVAAKLLQSDSVRSHRRQPSRLPGILQVRTLEWVAISRMHFFNAWNWKVKVKSLSCVRLLSTPWTAAYQAPPSMGFSRQEYCSGVPLPSLKQQVSSLVFKSLLIVNFSKLFLPGTLWSNLKLCLSTLLPTLSTSSLTVIKSSLLQPWVPRIGDSFLSQETQQNTTSWRETAEAGVEVMVGSSSGEGRQVAPSTGSESPCPTTKLWGDSHPVNITGIIFFCWVLEGRDGFLVLNSHGAQQSVDFFESSEFISAAAAKSLQSCPTLGDPIDGSPPGSPVPGILQARTLEWVAISFSEFISEWC